MLGRQGREHFLPPDLLAHRKGRGRGVEQDICPLAAGLGRGILAVAPHGPEVRVVPGVLADGQAQGQPLQFKGPVALSGLEVAVLVKDVVGGQKGLSEEPLQAAPPQQGRGVEQGPARPGRVLLGQAHQDRRTGGQVGGQPFPDPSAPADEIKVQEQIPGRIAHKGELRGDDQVGPQGPGLLHPGGDFGRVALQVAHDRVDLKHRQLHD